MQDLVIAVIVAIVVYFAVNAVLGLPFAVLTALIGFILALGLRRTFWRK